jgi:hypothetical protein
VAIDLAVVKAIVGTVLFGVEQAREGELVGNLDRVKTAIGPGDKAAIVTRGDRPDAHWSRPFAKSFVADAKQASALDVEPIECLFASDPHRALAKHGLDVGDNGDCAVHGERG